MGKYTNDDTFLARWLSNNLTNEELKDFEASEDYGAFLKIAEQSSKFEIPNFDKSKVKEQIKERVDSKKTVVRSLYYKIAIAASVLLIGVLGVAKYGYESTTTLVAELGELKSYTLPDGSIVELNGKSSISFNKKDWKNGKRNLNFTGEGYFKVEKGSKFTVESSEGKVSVLGTQFNVKTQANFFEVECYEGKVLVERNNNKTYLIRGNGVIYKNQKPHKTTFVNDSPNWKNKIYTYKEIPLQTVFNDLKNVYKIKDLNIEKVDLSKEFTGVLETQKLEKALDIICKPMGLKFTVKNKRIVDIRPR